MGYRHSDVPYWSGRGGITPPRWNKVARPTRFAPTFIVCSLIPGPLIRRPGQVSNSAIAGSTSRLGRDSLWTDNLWAQARAGPSIQLAPLKNPSGGWHAWAPDLRHSQIVATFAIMTRF